MCSGQGLHDKEVELAASKCEGCRINKQSPKLTSLHPWEFPEGPWKRIHLNFAGPIEGKQLMVMVDAYSKWPEVAIMEETTTDHTLREIGNTFARWGIPLQVVTDNGPQFISQQFEQFMKANNCKHTRTSPIILSRMGWQSALCSPLSKLSGPPEKRSHWHTG
jgi:hypothetical protein